MATITTSLSTHAIEFTPISTSINNLPNGAGTLAALVRRDSLADGDDICGLNNSTRTAFYMDLTSAVTTGFPGLDDGTSLLAPASGATPAGVTANDFFILVGGWPSGIATVRFHISSTMGAAESWTHVNSTGNKVADRAGPGATGKFSGAYNNSLGALNGDFALMAAWPGVRFADADAEALWISKKTSDWWNHPAGHPSLLVECNTLTPTDIGSDPSTFSTVGDATLTGLDPTGWTFDGRGAGGAGDDPPIGLLGRGAGW